MPSSERKPTLANPLWNPWANDKKLFDLYRRRARNEAEEMTCAKQAAEILASRVKAGETLLDAGCGSGYYYWSLAKRLPAFEYHGLDYTPELIELARQEVCSRARDVKPEQFKADAIENLDAQYDNVLCFNVLTNSPHYLLPLERLLKCAKQRLLLRESFADELTVRFTPDKYLDEDKRHIRVYHNTYPLKECVEFVKEHGFKVTEITDERSQGKMEMVVDIPHYWKILLAERI